jgi:hypothetical protein
MLHNSWNTRVTIRLFSIKEKLHKLKNSAAPLKYMIEVCGTLGWTTYYF